MIKLAVACGAGAFLFGWATRHADVAILGIAILLTCGIIRLMDGNLE